MHDLIERQAAIEIASGFCHPANIAKELAKLPPAQPEPCEDTISRQAVLDALQKHFNPTGAELSPDLASVLAGVGVVINTMPSSPSRPSWIPCSERLPEEENKSYWICTDGGYQCECRWTNVNHFWTNLTTDWHWHIMDVPQYSKVVAWMPLPEPYRAKRRTDDTD